MRLIFESRHRLFLFLSGRCVELHLNYLSLAVEGLVLDGETFLHASLSISELAACVVCIRLIKQVFARLCTDSDKFYLEDVTCRGRLQLSEHLVAWVTTGLVVSAQGVATREGDVRVAGLCLTQAPIPLASTPSSLQSHLLR